MRAEQRGGFAGRVLPAIGYSAFIFIMSALSAPPTPTFDLSWGDKVTHAGAYGLMTLFTFRATRWLLAGRGLRVQMLTAAGYAMLFGASDEIHQAFVPNRQCDLMDWIADATGALLALLFIRAIVEMRAGGLLFGADVKRKA